MYTLNVGSNKFKVKIHRLRTTSYTTEDKETAQDDFIMILEICNVQWLVMQPSTLSHTCMVSKFKQNEILSKKLMSCLILLKRIIFSALIYNSP